MESRIGNRDRPPLPPGGGDARRGKSNTAELRLSENAVELEDYALRFGRKGLERHLIAYEDLKIVVKQIYKGIPWDWAYVFTRQDARA